MLSSAEAMAASAAAASAAAGSSASLTAEEEARAAAAEADYMRKFEAQQRASSGVHASGVAVGGGQPLQGGAHLAASEAPQPMETSGAEAAEEDGEEEEEVEVLVGGVAKPISEVTQGDIDSMTDQEFQRYNEVCQSLAEQ